MNERVRLLLRSRQGLASPSRRLRGEASFAGSFVPGDFPNSGVARQAAESYFERRADVDEIHLIAAESGQLLEVLKR